MELPINRLAFLEVAFSNGNAFSYRLVKRNDCRFTVDNEFGDGNEHAVRNIFESVNGLIL